MPGAFFRNVGAVAAVRVSGGALLFASQLLLAVWMGAGAFGAYSLAWAWVAVLATLAGLGLPGTSVRFIARYRVEDDGTRLRGLLRFGRAVVLTAGTVLAVLGIALAPLVVTDAAYVGALQLAFVAVPILALLNLDAAYARGFDWMAMSAVAEQILRPVILLLLAAAVAAWMSGPGAAHFVAACVCAYLLASLAQHYLVSRKIRTALPAGEARQESHTWLAVSGFMLVLNGSQMIRANLDPILLGLLLSPTDVGIYTAALRTATLVSFVFMISSVVAQPAISSLHTRQSQAELSRFVVSTTRGVFVASLLVGLGLAAMGRFILSLFGAEFVAAYPALLILIAGHVLAAAFGPLTSVLMMTGRHRAAATIHAVSLPVQALLSVFLIGSLGVRGAALAAATGLLLTQFILYVIAGRRAGS